MQPTQFTAVTDTNVLLDIYSCHDVAGTYDNAHARLGGAAAVDEQSVVYRRARARESFLLATYFNKIRATTYSLHSESLELLTRRVPPPGPGGQTLELDFTTVFLYFMKDYLLPDWHPAAPTEPGTEARNEADRSLVAFAQQHALPLITNEGYTQRGVVDEKMRRMAKDAGVQVFTPREFLRGRIDEATEIERFLCAFRDQAPLYMDARRKEVGEDRIGDVLDWVYGYYLLILRGEAQGRDVPVRVSLTWDCAQTPR